MHPLTLLAVVLIYSIVTYYVVRLAVAHGAADAGEDLVDRLIDRGVLSGPTSDPLK